MQRTLDDIGEDVLFIVLGQQHGPNKLHRRFLERFWQEEFEEGVAPIDSTVNRYNVSRTEMRDWLNKANGVMQDGPEAKSGRIVQQVYSGFVHGASPHIMEMCAGPPPFHFVITGMKDTTRQQEYEDDLWNYCFRGLLTVSHAALAFGDRELFNQLSAYRDDFERRSGTNYRDRDQTG